jgi:hypothetical protein
MSRVLFISLQASSGSSKGHINPLVPVVSKLRDEGHTLLWLPLPNPFGAADRAHVEGLGVQVIDPPALPTSTRIDDAALSQLAMNPARAWEAY